MELPNEVSICRFELLRKSQLFHMIEQWPTAQIILMELESQPCFTVSAQCFQYLIIIFEIQVQQGACKARISVPKWSVHPPPPTEFRSEVRKKFSTWGAQVGNMPFPTDFCRNVHRSTLPTIMVLPKLPKNSLETLYIRQNSATGSNPF